MSLIILKFILFVYLVGYYVIFSYNNSEKLIFKIADILVTILLMSIIIYSIANFDIGILLGIITGFGVSIKIIFDDKEKSKKITYQEKEKTTDIEQEIIKLIKYAKEIENGNYTVDFINGGYKYSDNIQYLPLLLTRLQIDYESSIDDRKKLLSKSVKNFSFEDCMDYFNYVWHLEAGLAVGTIKKQIESGKYIKVMKKFINYLEEKYYN